MNLPRLRQRTDLLGYRFSGASQCARDHQDVTARIGVQLSTPTGGPRRSEPPTDCSCVSAMLHGTAVDQPDMKLERPSARGAFAIE